MSYGALASRNTMPPTAELTRGKSLRTLLSGMTATLPPDIAITDLTLDSRAVMPGAAFVAVPGTRTHGIGYAAQAVSADARAILWEPVANVVAPVVPSNVALVAIPELTQKLGAIADRFFDAPSRAITLAGVTGTNGKTTTAYVIATALARLGRSAAYGGTIGFGPIDELEPAAHTTPDCITVQRNLARLRERDVRFLAMEVSSHGLDQHRVDGARFDTAVFTNLTRDHLDYHGTFDAYGAAKARLFAWPGLRAAVINIGDTFGRTLAMRVALTATVTLYGRATDFFPGAKPTGARELIASDVRVGEHGLVLVLDGSWGVATLHSRFIGDFNVDNLLAVLATLLGWDIPLRDAIAALEQCTAPPGRMEMLVAPDFAGKPGALAVIDYAHTPDALAKALAAARQHCTGRLICVFGCGGDRDRGKRPLMGAIAEAAADRVIVTDDNPRTEDGERIVADILGGITQRARVLVERDRARAIELALASASTGDVVLIAGKGHEDYQIVGTETRHFSDREVAQAALGKRT
jgi:UDP-N-acetylmuramoyl-L-alanyl-D-glutamate--2,6-diaminopimelate ligase